MSVKMQVVSRNKQLRDILEKYPDDAEVYIDVYEKLCIVVNNEEVGRIACDLEEDILERQEFEKWQATTDCN